MDVLCQVGLDGIRMLDPNTSRTLRIYPLETVTRWDVLDSSVFAFWSKSSVDLEARRIRLKSSSYTTNTILDTVTAASVQFKEMASSVSRSKAAADPASPSEQQNEKRRNFLDWRNLVKPVTEEKDHWVPDEAVNKCTACAGDFSAFNRRHHCRNCGDIFCDKCTQGRTPLTSDADSQPVRVCDRCMAEVSRRLSSAKEAANRPVVQSHEDLAKKLQEAMDINKKSSSGSRSSDGSSGKRMREVACPICTVHLQIDILKRLQRQAFYDIMQLRDRQEKVEKVLTLFKSHKVGPFAEESTRVKGLINFTGALALNSKEGVEPYSSEANSGISSQFAFRTSVRKKDSLLAELATDSRYFYQENDLMGSPLVLSKVMYLANVSDHMSVAAVPVGARCDDFSTDPSIQEGQWVPSFHTSLRPPLLLKRHKRAAGLILRSQNFAASLAELISTAAKSSGEASSIFTGFGQISCKMCDDIKLTMSAAWHGPSAIPRKSKPTAGGCLDFELKFDEDSRFGAWVEVKRSNPRQLKWAVTLSDTPENDLGWGVSLRRGSEGAPERIQLEGFLNLHLGQNATLQPGVMFNLDGRRCAPALVFRSSWFL
uniref:Lateral signaling target 2-like protein n=2 Tax=Aegilops tauschii TaxID=37682 RepID=N1QT30_AEGTA